MTNRSGKSDGVLGGTLALSIGTAAARGLSALSQLLLAFWLLPSDFGHWAAALASLTFFTSVANFGEVNGYLAGRNPSFTKMRAATRRLNGILTAAALLVAVVIGFVNSWDVGLLAIFVALSIPLQGESDVLYALGVKQRRYKRVILSQIAAAFAKLALGVALAALWSSPVSIAISTVVFYLVMVLGLLALARGLPTDDLPPGHTVGGKERFSWAVNSLVMSLPLQIGFFVAQFVTTSDVLGIYYLSFQITLGLSGLLAVPLARVSLAAFGEKSGASRLRLAMGLSHALGASVLALVAAVGLVLPLVEPFLSENWLPAVPVTLIMLASMPIRLVGPVLEGFQQSANRWWQSTTFNIIETVASALIALSLIAVSLEVFAMILTMWRLAFGIVRMCIVFRGAGVVTLGAFILPMILGTLLLCLAAVSEEPILWSTAALALGALWAGIILAAHRRAGRASNTL